MLFLLPEMSHIVVGVKIEMYLSVLAFVFRVLIHPSILRVELLGYWRKIKEKEKDNEFSTTNSQ